ncbi:unnamed protein product [Sphagnum balticum]
MGPLQAMSASWTATRGCVAMLILFAGTMHLLMSLGAIAFIIGMIPAYMVMMVARAQVYDRLVDTCPELAAPEPTTGSSSLALQASAPEVTSAVAQKVEPNVVSEAVSHSEAKGVTSEATIEATPSKDEAGSSSEPVI